MIPVNAPLLDGNEKQYLMECIESGYISSEGPFVKRFESEFAVRVGRKYGVAVCNGTAAIDAAIEALGIGAGDEVVVPAFTIISCVNQLVRAGARPVLVDSDPLTWNMDVQQLEKKISKRTKAIMVVHIYGLPVDMDPVLKIAGKFDLPVIEDAAQAHGQRYNGRPCGSFGQVSTFSFYPNKHVTTGEGGMILTDSENLANSCRSLRNLCFEERRRFVHERLGWNLRMTNMQAAIGVAQLERLDEFIARKKRMGAMYSELLSKSGVQLPIARTSYAENNYWVYGIVLRQESNLSASELIDRLRNVGIGCRPFFCPMHMQPVLQRMNMFADQEYPVSESLYKYGLYIPSGLALTEADIRTVADSVEKALLTRSA